MKEITIELTNYCNHNCLYCSSNAITDRNKAIFIDIATVKLRIEGKQYDRINLSGGEPLSHPRFYDILELCKLNAKDVIVYTNALNHIRYNANVLDGIYLEANITILPEIDQIHILRRIKQGKERNRPEVHLSNNFECDCECEHIVVLPNGEIGKTPCNKHSELEINKKVYENKIFISGPHGVGKTTLINDISNKYNIYFYKNNTKNPYSNDIKRRQLWRLLKYKCDDEIIKTFSNEKILINRCCLDWLIYTNTFKKLNWITIEDYNFLIDQYKKLFENNIPDKIVFLNPPINWSKERIVNRWKGQSKKWREDNFEYYDNLREEYEKIYSNTSKITNVIEINDIKENIRINKVLQKI